MASQQGYYRLDDRLSTIEAASYLGLKVETLHKWRCIGKGPAYYKFGRLINYTRRDLDIFIEKNSKRIVPTKAL